MNSGNYFVRSPVLVVCVLAALAGAKNYREIATVAADIPQGMLRALGAKWDYFTQRYKCPRKITIWLTLTSVDAAELDRITGTWLLSQARKRREGDGSYTWEIAIDGKVMRGAWTDENDKVTLFSAMLQSEAVTIGQVRVPDGTNEITQVEALINEIGIQEGESVLATLDANTRDLRHVGFDEAVTWCFAVVWRRAGLLVRVWVSNPALRQGAPCAFYCA